VETLTLARGCNQCPPYPSVDYGAVAPAGPVGAGDHVEITCDEGFEPKPVGDDGNVSPQCQYNMQYTAGVECVAMCPILAPPPHGHLEPSGDVEMFEWVTLHCDKGHKVVGNRYVMCKPDHEYLFDHGTCVATCPLYPQVRHGHVTRQCHGLFGACDKDVSLAGDSVEVECDEDFTLSFESSATATCGEGGEYDHDPAVCVPVCQEHPHVEHGILSVTGPTVLGDEVQITCDDGYELEEPEMAAVVCTDMHTYTQPWIQGKTKGHTGEYSRCVAVCPPYPYVDYSTITVDGSWEKASDPVREGSVVQVCTCNSIVFCHYRVARAMSHPVRASSCAQASIPVFRFSVFLLLCRASACAHSYMAFFFLSCSLQVTCSKGYEPGPYNGGVPTAKCVDGGKGGVYDPPVCPQACCVCACVCVCVCVYVRVRARVFTHTHTTQSLGVFTNTRAHRAHKCVGHVCVAWYFEDALVVCQLCVCVCVCVCSCMRVCVCVMYEYII